MDAVPSFEVMCKPVCKDEFKPCVGKKFKTVEDAIVFYNYYARAVGFDTRKSGTKSSGDVITWQYIVCSREGQKRTVDGDATNARQGFANKRRRASKRCGCNARISFKYFSDFGVSGYVIHQFVEEHNHSMVEAQHKKFMRLNRKPDQVHRKFIEDCAKVNIGATLTSKLLNELMEGYDVGGCTIVLDVKKCARDMKANIEGSDAQMLLDVMRRKKETCGGFTFEFELDVEDKLNRLFWCDSVSRKNYHYFGDVISFDTTYSTNRYNMIFASFTGKDNHARPVTFAAGLLCKEDVDSFSWLLSCFVRCMGSSPKLITIDQDSDMKVATEQVLVNTRHRWCMWHTMLKLADQVPKNLLANEDFKNELNACVWSDLIEPIEFEESWKGIMERYGLEKEEWFKTMFDSRGFWAPAFFRDCSMSSVIRTTSIFEPENSFFKRNTKPSSSLLEFIMRYDNALDTQRNLNAKLNYTDSTIVPILAAHELSIEKHASTIYTGSMFKTVQAEIVDACYNCFIVEMSVDGNPKKYKLRDDRRNIWTVIYDSEHDSYECVCKLFERSGILCSHIFFVLKNNGVMLIPEKYFGWRWLKNSLGKAVHGVSSEESQTGVDEKQKALNRLCTAFYELVHKLEGDMNKDQILAVTAKIRDFGQRILGDGSCDTSILKCVKTES